jgi:hypothetical protein
VTEVHTPPTGPQVSLPRGPAPMVTPNGSAKLSSRRPGREFFPASWLKRRVKVTLREPVGDLSGTLLEYYATAFAL